MRSSPWHSSMIMKNDGWGWQVKKSNASTFWDRDLVFSLSSAWHFTRNRSWDQRTFRIWEGTRPYTGSSPQAETKSKRRDSCREPGLGTRPLQPGCLYCRLPGPPVTMEQTGYSVPSDTSVTASHQTLSGAGLQAWGSHGWSTLSPSIGKWKSPAASLGCLLPPCVHGEGDRGSWEGSDAAFQTLLPFHPQNSLARSPSGRTASPWKCFFFSLSIWTAPRFTSRSSSEGKNPSVHTPWSGDRTQRSLTRGDREVPPLEWFIQSVKREDQPPPFPSHSHRRKWSSL